MIPLSAVPTTTSTATSTSTTTAPAVPKVDADLVTPGLRGFVLLFVLAVAVYFLGRSMARRIQRVNHRARAEAEERAASTTPAPPGQDPPGPSQG